MDKEARYRDLLAQIRTFACADDNAISVLANCVALMKVAFPKEYFWVGFTLLMVMNLFLVRFRALLHAHGLSMDVAFAVRHGRRGAVLWLTTWKSFLVI